MQVFFLILHSLWNDDGQDSDEVFMLETRLHGPRGQNERTVISHMVGQVNLCSRYRRAAAEIA